LRRLSGTQALAYSCGNLAAGVYYALNNFTLPLYLKLFTNNDILIGYLSSTRSFEQAIIQPAVGAWSDRTWTRVGRRAPFFLIAMPLSAFFIVVNGLLPHDRSILLVVVATVFLFSLLFNLGIDPYVALLADVTPSEQRGTVNGIAAIFGNLSQIVLLIIAALWIESHIGWIFFLVAAGLVVGFALVAFGVREPRERFEIQKVSRHSLAEMFFKSPRRTFSIFISYLGKLYREQHEATKLLGVRFLYQFGINAAAPFLTLFVSTEIGTRGWPELVAGTPWLAQTGLGRIDAQGLSQLVGAFFLITTLFFVLPCGWLGDRWGKKRIFALGLVVMGVFGIIAAFAGTIPQLLFYLIFLGLGNAAINVLFFPYLSDLVPAYRIGEFQGLSATAETGGVFLSAVLAGALIDLNLFHLHYRLIFIITGLFLLLGFVAVLFVKARLDEIKLAPVLAEPG
jgi:maltose/moltooligosaccharide transporter